MSHENSHASTGSEGFNRVHLVDSNFEVGISAAKNHPPEVLKVYN